MKGINNHSALDAYQRVAVSPVSPTRPAESAPTGGEAPRVDDNAAQVTLSSTARSLAAEVSQGQESARVADLKSQVQTGTYQVNPTAIATSMFETIA